MGGRFKPRRCADVGEGVAERGFGDAAEGRRLGADVGLCWKGWREASPVMGRTLRGCAPVAGLGRVRRGRVIFRDQSVAVIEEASRPRGAAADFVEPAHGVVGEPDRARCSDEPVLDVVGEAAAAVRGEFAVGVVDECRPARRAVLIESVGGVGAARLIMARPPGISVVVTGDAGDPRGGVVAEGRRALPPVVSWRMVARRPSFDPRRAGLGRSSSSLSRGWAPHP
jgi:hypothetical protein